MEAYETEEQQVAAIKEWWKNNYKKVAVLFVVGIVAILGVQNYKQNKVINQEAASDHFKQVLIGAETKQIELVRGRADILKSEFPDSSYAVLAALLKAKTWVDEKKYVQAITELEWAELNSDDISIKEIAFIRRIKLLMQTGKVDLVLTQLNSHLEQSEKDKSSFNPVLLEIKGDALVLLNKKKEAKLSYDKALSGFLLVGVSTELLQIKRNDLGD